MLNRQKLGRGLISSQADSDGCDLYHGEEVGRELFVAGYNAGVQVWRSQALDY